jgi:hypothetical protein
MIPQFEKLSSAEQQLLMKAPILLSVLAACSEGEVNQAQKTDAINLAHIKTFTSIPLLRPYYLEVEKNFREQFEKTAAAYYPFDAAKREELKSEIRKTRAALNKVEKVYADLLGHSLWRYASHVKRATHSVFRDFIFPLAMPDLHDEADSSLKLI